MVLQVDVKGGGEFSLGHPDLPPQKHAHQNALKSSNFSKKLYLANLFLLCSICSLFHFLYSLSSFLKKDAMPGIDHQIHFCFYRLHENLSGKFSNWWQLMTLTPNFNAAQSMKALTVVYHLLYYSCISFSYVCILMRTSSLKELQPFRPVSVPLHFITYCE